MSAPISLFLPLLVVLHLAVVPAEPPPSPSPGPDCPALRMPVDGPVVAPFAPIGRFAGHWGIDLAATPGETVQSPGVGRVSFAGSVAGRRSVTVALDRGPLVTVSYLERVRARAGDRVVAGTPLGTSGRAHGREAVHVSVRIGGEYVDPLPVIACRLGHLPDALRLVE